MYRHVLWFEPGGLERRLGQMEENPEMQSRKPTKGVIASEFVGEDSSKTETKEEENRLEEDRRRRAPSSGAIGKPPTCPKLPPTTRTMNLVLIIYLSMVHNGDFLYAYLATQDLRRLYLVPRKNRMN